MTRARVIIGLAHIPPPRPIRSADELRLQAALLEPRTAHPAPFTNATHPPQPKETDMSTNSTPDWTALEAAIAAEQAANEQAHKLATDSAAIAAAKLRAWLAALPAATGDDLVLLNEAAAELLARGLDPSNAAAIVNNNWQPDGNNTVESLMSR